MRFLVLGVVLVTLTVSATGAGAPPATAGPYLLDPAVLVSGPSLFAGCADGATNADSFSYTDSEVEPQVAVNPTNPDHIVGVFQQDRWNDGGARGLVAATSNDGGTTWARNFATFSICSGGDPDYLRASDPWVSFDAGGRLYQISLSVDSAAFGISSILVSTSSDNGSTWDAPVTLQRDENPVNANDKETITGDWTRPHYAYATWLRSAVPGENRSLQSLSRATTAIRGHAMFSKTTDGGATWSTPVPMLGNQNIYSQGNQIAVLPDGTLVNVFAALYKGSGIQPPQAKQVFMAVTRSTDGGRHWSAPIKIAPLDLTLLTDPDNPNPNSFNETIRADDYLPDIAVDRQSGDLYVVWADGLGTSANNVVISKSSDGGKRWTTPKAIDQTPGPHAFNQTVQVAGDGTVAVLYYDFRNNTPDAGLPTDVWLAQSTDGGETWTEQHVTGPFDMKLAPVARGYFLGDYQGLEAIGNDLIAFFSTTQGDQANVWSIRARR